MSLGISGRLGSTPLIEIDGGNRTTAVLFSADGEYLVSGGEKEVQIWQVQDGKQVATMQVAGNVRCLAISRDGAMIAAGTYSGQVIAWDTYAYEQAFSFSLEHDYVNGVDFSPDSMRLLVALDSGSATVWDVLTNRQVLDPLQHEHYVIAAKYSPRGDWIATASTYDSVRIYDSNDGRLLVDTKVNVMPWHNTGLLWLTDQLFIVSDGKINQVDGSTGSTVSEWPVLDTNLSSCVTLPQHGDFIAFSTKDSVTLLDTLTHAKLGVIQHAQTISSIAISPDDQHLVIGGNDGKIAICKLSDVLPASYFTAPFIGINNTVFGSWKQSQLADTEVLLTRMTSNSGHLSHYALANRALVRAQLRYYDLAIDDAEKSIEIRPSVIGYIAKSVALISRGEKKKGCRAYDFVFRQREPFHVDLLLLIKAIVLFMAGEHDDAVSRIDDLIATMRLNSMYRVVQAYMYLSLGNTCMENRDYEGAIQSFVRAQAQMPSSVGPRLFPISLICGWRFDNLGITIRQRLCEALYSAGRAKEGGDSLLEMINTFGEAIYIGRSVTEWVSDFARRCLSTGESNGNAATTLYICPDLPTPSPLLRQWARATLVDGGWRDALVAATSFTAPRFTIYQAVCDHLETRNRVMDAIECFRQMNSELAGKIATQFKQAEWVADFKQRCAKKLEYLGDKATDNHQHDHAIDLYSTALSLNPSFPQYILVQRSKVYVAKGLWEDALEDASRVVALVPLSPWNHGSVLMEWAKEKLMGGSWRGALKNAGGFKVARFMIYQVLCERLEILGHITDMVECFRSMENELTREVQGKELMWILDFKYRICHTLEDLGDVAMDFQQYDEAVFQYSAALSFNQVTPLDLFIKRSKAYLARGLWGDALNDANKAIAHDSSSPWGYERKYVALLRAGDHINATNSFNVMLSKMLQSSDPEIRGLHSQYIDPARTKAVIRAAIQKAIRDSPLTLIHTVTGRLLDKFAQASSFESQPIFAELISSMIMHIDHARIEQEVAAYYRYAMFSHKWEDNEPLFDKVAQVVVYDLGESPTHNKLRMFCKIVRDAGFHWAWSDTCCINKADHFVLQEALVAMFKWYEGSAMTIVFLCDVGTLSQPGDLGKSIWNTRAWTFQEYHASKVVRFYTKDWTPYMNLDIPNHKESPEIISEMEKATGVSARSLMALRPGLDDIREKLRLASTRHTTRAEDAAYSLLGTFSVSLPVVYGEGDKALGRLLAQLLTSSGDASILAWTGRSGSFNSCLPTDISVFNELPTSHLPAAIEEHRLGVIITRLRASFPSLSFATKLYDQVSELPVPLFAGQRMKLPCITFKLGSLSAYWSNSEYVFRGQTTALGIVEVRTNEDISRFDSLYLVHPWIDYLLDRQPIGNVIETIPEEGTEGQNPVDNGPLPLSGPGPSNVPEAASPTRASRLASRFRFSFGGRSTTNPPDVASLRPPSTVLQTDKEMRALRLVARLRQPFGALLLTPKSGNVAAYRRVAAESRITVRVEEITPAILNKLAESVRILDVL